MCCHRHRRRLQPTSTRCVSIGNQFVFVYEIWYDIDIFKLIAGCRIRNGKCMLIVSAMSYRKYLFVQSKHIFNEFMFDDVDVRPPSLTHSCMLTHANTHTHAHTRPYAWKIVNRVNSHYQRFETDIKKKNPSKTLFRPGPPRSIYLVQ